MFMKQKGLAISNEELNQIWQRCNAATNGPWVSYIERLRKLLESAMKSSSDAFRKATSGAKNKLTQVKVIRN